MRRRAIVCCLPSQHGRCCSRCPIPSTITVPIQRSRGCCGIAKSRVNGRRDASSNVGLATVSARIRNGHVTARKRSRVEGVSLRAFRWHSGVCFIPGHVRRARSRVHAASIERCRARLSVRPLRMSRPLHSALTSCRGGRRFRIGTLWCRQQQLWVRWRQQGIRVVGLCRASHGFCSRGRHLLGRPAHRLASHGVPVARRKLHAAHNTRPPSSRQRQTCKHERRSPRRGCRRRG